jgi:hypothetical protein
VAKSILRAVHAFATIRSKWRSKEMDRKSRLDEAKRRHRQARDLPKLRQLIADRTALGDQFSVRDVNESVVLEKHLYEKIRDLRVKRELTVAVGLDGGEFERRAAAALRMERETPLLVFLCRWSNVGAIVLTGEQLARNARALLELDGDTVTACTPNLDWIISFDLTVESYGRQTFEIDEWRQQPKNIPVKPEVP